MPGIPFGGELFVPADGLIGFKGRDAFRRLGRKGNAAAGQQESQDSRCRGSGISNQGITPCVGSSHTRAAPSYFFKTELA